ncbi:MAG: acylphosphatase [Calditrichaeota bacterium]|nr:MAG: acylphosphatase [Calditrichota bacterium]
MERKQVKIIAGGVVQGVGFRYFVWKNAQKLSLNGYVRNLFDGTVEIVAEGPARSISAFIDIIRIGPPHAHVTQFSVERIEPAEIYQDFTIFH